GKWVRVQLARRGVGKGSGGSIRIGDEFSEEQRLRREPGGRDDIVRELSARERVVDSSRSHRAKVAALQRRGRHAAVEDQPLPFPHPLVAREEERLVAPVVELRNRDGPSERAAELFALEDFALSGEEVARVEFVVAQELKKPAMKRVRSGFRRAVQQAARVAEFGGVGALLHLEFL